jgi:hypothetical protein
MFEDFFYGKKIPSPIILYKNFKNWPAVYNDLFPVDHLPQEKKKYVPLVRTLLSLNPRDRLHWLDQQQQQKKQTRTNKP